MDMVTQFLTQRDVPNGESVACEYVRTYARRHHYPGMTSPHVAVSDDADKNRRGSRRAAGCRSAA